MRIAICDDEELQCRLLAEYLKEWSLEQKLCLETIPFSSAESFLFHWEDDKAFDLLILDIEMGKLNGVDLALKLRAEGNQIPLLFITGYESYMAQGYEVSALHYLLKPVNKEKLFTVLNRLRQMPASEQKVLFQTIDGPLSLPPSDIWYIEASAKHCVLSTDSHQYELRHGLGEIRGILAEKKSFVTSHRSFLVNLAHVSLLLKNELILDNHTRIPLSRSCAREVNKAFIQLYTKEGGHS